MAVVGLDLGSVNAKIVALEEGQAIYKRIIPSRFDTLTAGKELINDFIQTTGKKPEEIMVTGYGRVSFPEGKVVTEITCQAKGCHHSFPEYPFILDLGGQDAKAIKKSSHGKVVKFMMNDKCAAGTGRFLDVILKGLEINPSELDLPEDIKPVTIKSMCTVFAESEVITLLAKGAPKAEVIAGLFKSTAKRLAYFVESLGASEPLIFTGGGAHYRQLINYLEKELKLKIIIPPEPELTAALGAALLVNDWSVRT